MNPGARQPRRLDMPAQSGSILVIFDSTDHERISTGMVNRRAYVNTRPAVDRDESVVEVPHLADFNNPLGILCDESCRLRRDVVR